MTLGEIIKKYRIEHQMSMDAFSAISGISKAYISLLEKNKHPKTGKTIAPSIASIKQAADGMGMDFNTLFNMIDGDVTIEEKKRTEWPSDSIQQCLSPDETSLLADYKKLNSIGKDKVREYANDLTEQERYRKDTESSEVSVG